VTRAASVNPTLTSRARLHATATRRVDPAWRADEGTNRLG